MITFTVRLMPGTWLSQPCLEHYRHRVMWKTASARTSKIPDLRVERGARPNCLACKNTIRPQTSRSAVVLSTALGDEAGPSLDFHHSRVQARGVPLPGIAPMRESRSIDTIVAILDARSSGGIRRPTQRRGLDGSLESRRRENLKCSLVHLYIRLQSCEPLSTVRPPFPEPRTQIKMGALPRRYLHTCMPLSS